MRTVLRAIWRTGLCLLVPAMVWGQATTSDPPPVPQRTTPVAKARVSPGKEIGRGGADIGKGVAQGTADIARGTADGVGSLAHGSLGGAGASFGRGVVGMGKAVTVGSAKGVGRIGKGLGGEFRKIGRR